MSQICRGPRYAQRIFISERYGNLTGPFAIIIIIINIIIIIIIKNSEGLGLVPVPEPSM
jgi:hypothetical protein